MHQQLDLVRLDRVIDRVQGFLERFTKRPKPAGNGDFVRWDGFGEGLKPRE